MKEKKVQKTPIIRCKECHKEFWWHNMEREYCIQCKEKAKIEGRWLV